MTPLHRAIELTGLKQRRIAEDLFISDSYLSELKRGHKKPGRALSIRIIKYFKPKGSKLSQDDF
jgi:hypothetical protein